MDGSYLFNTSIHFLTILYIFLLLFVVICLTVVYFLTDFCGKLTTYMVRYLNYMVQFLRFQSDTTNNDVRNILVNIRKKCLLVWFGLPPALFRLVLATAVTLGFVYRSAVGYGMPCHARCNCVNQVRNLCFSKKMCNDKIRYYVNDFRKCNHNIRIVVR